MKFLLKSLFKFLDVFESILLGLMTLFVFSNVVARYVFGQSFGWTDEAARYLFIWMIFIGALIAYKDNSHLGVDVVVGRLSLKGKRIFYVLNNVCILLILILFSVGAVKYVSLTAQQHSSALSLPLSYVYASGLIAIVGMAVITASRLYRFFTHQVNEDQMILISSEESDKFEEATNGNSAEGANKA